MDYSDSVFEVVETLVERTHPTKEEPVLLILVRHSTHKNLENILFGREAYVKPPSSHYAQIATFGQSCNAAF